MARNIKDLAVALTVMASVGYDAADNTTAAVSLSPDPVDYSRDVYGGSLRGMRFGLIQGFFNFTSSNETTPVNNAMGDMVAELESAGATVVPINDTVYNATSIAVSDVLTSEYSELMDAYLQGSSGNIPPTLKDLYSSQNFLVIPSQYDYVNTALKSSTSNASYAVNKLRIQNLTTVLRTTFSVHKLDALIYPEQKNLVVKLGSPSQSGRNGILAALTGFPVLVVPGGFSPASTDAPIGVPIGMEILGLPWSEGKLLNIASHISNIKTVRRMPSFANASVETAPYDSVPSIIPDTSEIPKSYPIGIL